MMFWPRKRLKIVFREVSKTSVMAGINSLASQRKNQERKIEQVEARTRPANSNWSITNIVSSDICSFSMSRT